MGEVSRSERNAAWIESHCRVPEGKHVGQPVTLTSHQRRWLAEIYDTPTRTFILSMPRKNAKTAFTAFLLLLHLCGPEARANSQLYSAAQSRDQAAVLFALAAKMVRMSPDLSAFVVVRDTAKELGCPELGTLYKALSAEADTAHGKSPVFLAHDELGRARGPRSELYEALETGCAAHDSPLSIIISTQAPTSGDVLSVLIDDALTGSDPMVKVVLYAAPDDADAFADATIEAANPHFHDFMNKDEVFRQRDAAKRMPSSEAAYRNLVLNQRINTVHPFISRTSWEAAAGEVDEAAFRAGPVDIGLDLSAKNDLTAAVMVASLDGVTHSRAMFWTPEQGLRERSIRDRVPYDLWVAQGYIVATPGSSVQYEYVAQWLADQCATYNVRSIPFDRWRIDVLKAELERMGADLPLVPYGQGFKDMTPALDALEGALLNGAYRHGNNPVLTWCATNAIAVSDPAGNRKLDKSKSTGRIDGIQALAMAMGHAASAEQADDISGWLANPVRG